MLLPNFFPIDLGLRFRQQRRLEGSDGVTQDIENSRNDKNGTKVTKLSKRGFYANASDDYFRISVDLTMKSGMEGLYHFIAIAEHEIAFASQIQTFLIQVIVVIRGATPLTVLTREWRGMKGKQ
jgi:hypothetical protein